MSWVKKRYPHEIFRCRVYPDGKGRYYTVILFKTLKAMRKAFASLGYSWNYVKDAMGACESLQSISYRKLGKSRTSPLCGIVLFAKGYEGAGISTHEFTHAALGFMRRNHKDLAGLNGSASAHAYRVCCDVEEALARAAGAMASQFYRKLERKFPELWKR